MADPIKKISDVELLEKLKDTLQNMMDEIGSNAELEVDGGINLDTVASVVNAGATVLVAGSAIFNQHASVAENIQMLRNAFH